MGSTLLTAPVKDGQIQQTASPTNASKETRGSGELGKDAFLNLLVAQMRYQDPLNPSSDTEWISQMATFSSLEEMQNMGSTLLNSQALGLVGEAVIMKSTTVDGNTLLVGGIVEYVVMQNGKAYFALDTDKDNLYSIDDLDTVTSKEYLESLKNNGEVTDGSDKTDNSDKTDGSDKTEGSGDGESDKTESDTDKK